MKRIIFSLATVLSITACSTAKTGSMAQSAESDKANQDTLDFLTVKNVIGQTIFSQYGLYHAVLTTYVYLNKDGDKVNFEIEKTLADNDSKVMYVTIPTEEFVNAIKASDPNHDIVFKEKSKMLWGNMSLNPERDPSEVHSAFDCDQKLALRLADKGFTGISVEQTPTSTLKKFNPFTWGVSAYAESYIFGDARKYAPKATAEQIARYEAAVAEHNAEVDSDSGDSADTRSSAGESAESSEARAKAEGGKR